MLLYQQLQLKLYQQLQLKRRAAEADAWEDLAGTWEDLTYRWQDRADRWRRYAVTTFIGLVVIWAGFMAYVMATPIKAPVLVGRTMTIHCPSEDGGRPGCVWDTWTDGNGRGDPDGPRWLVWP